MVRVVVEMTIETSLVLLIAWEMVHGWLLGATGLLFLRQ